MSGRRGSVCDLLAVFIVMKEYAINTPPFLVSVRHFHTMLIHQHCCQHVQCCKFLVKSFQILRLSVWSALFFLIQPRPSLCGFSCSNLKIKSVNIFNLLFSHSPHSLITCKINPCCLTCDLPSVPERTFVKSSKNGQNHYLKINKGIYFFFDRILVWFLGHSDPSGGKIYIYSFV